MTFKLRLRNSKKVTMTLKRPSKKSKTENVNSINYQRRLLNSTMAFLKTILRFLDSNDRSEIWNQKFKDLPNNLQIEVLKMKN